MIDHKFLSAYSKTFEACSSLEEAQWFAKHLYENKISSKQWLAEELLKITKPANTLLLGSWYCTYLPYLLKSTSYTCVDIDPSVVYLSKKFNENLQSKYKIDYVTGDARSFLQANQKYFDVIINTSCEHMPYDMKDVIWDRRSMYVFQSNDYDIEEHINRKKSLNDFIDSCGLSNIHYSGQLQTKKYTRFMVIGNI